jgi:uncharacterized phiE125 gp8 family phage protein
MSDPILVTPPSDLLSVEEAKLHLRGDHDEEDDLIAVLIAAAVAWMDGWQGILGRCILTQTWSFTAPALASMKLPFPDVQSAIVSYLDAAGEEQVVDPADYRVRTIKGVGHLTFAEDFAAPAVLSGRDDAVTVTIDCGQAEAPAPLKVAALMLVAHWYRHREGGTDDIPAPVKAVVAPFRVGLV